MGRSPCCDGSGIKTGHWTPEEDQKLINYIQKNGHGSWRALPKLAGLNRCGKSCRLRWINYLRSDIKRGKFSPEEEQAILHLHSILGNKWSAISTHLPGRTDNEIKNFWNTRLKKKLIHMGIDPTTHKPRTDLFATLPQLMALAGIRGMVEQYRAWDDHAARLQAEALRLAKLQCFPGLLQFPATLSNTNTDISSVLFNAQVPSTITSGPFPGLLPAAATGPRVEISCGFEQSLGNYMLQDLIPPLVNQEGSSALSAAVPLPSSSLPGVANDPLGNEDNYLTSSYGGSVASPNLWSGILDYSLVTELI